MRVFISYRRGDVGGYAGRLADSLVRRLGTRSVFQDVTAIGPGRDFGQAIDRALDDCDAVLAVIGPGWLDASTPEGARRLDEADDYVRLEVGRALERHVTVVPVLVGGAALPSGAALPPDLRELTRRQAVTLHDETWHEDTDGLVRSLRGESPGTAGRSPVLLAAVAVVVVLALVAGLWWWRSGSGEDEAEDEASAELPPCEPTTGSDWTSIALGSRPRVEQAVQDSLNVFGVTAAHQRALGPGRWQITLDLEAENATPNEQYHGSWNYDHLSVARRSFAANCFLSDPELLDPGAIGDGRLGFEVRCAPVGYIGLVLSDGGVIDVTDSAESGSC